MKVDPKDFVSNVFPHRHVGPKEALPLFSWAVFKGNLRRLQLLILVTALAFDVDVPLPSVDALVAMLALVAPLAWHVHSSFSSVPGALRFRVVVPLSRPMAPEEHRAIWPVFASALASSGVEVDGACKDGSRGYYTPTIPPNGVYDYRSLEGESLDVDAWLRLAQAFQSTVQLEREVEAAQAARRLARSPMRAGNSSAPIDRARAYVANVPFAVSGQHGHARTFDLAMRLVRGFALSDAEALALMAPWNASCSPPWPAQALARKVAEARAKGNMPFGHLLERGRRSA